MIDEDTKLNQDVEDFIKELMQRALSGQHTPIELLKNTNALFAASASKYGLRAVIKAFKLNADTIFKAYLNGLKSGVDKLELLTTYRQFKHCCVFYEEEYKQTKLMITEFHNYMLSPGNFINTLLGGERPDDQMHTFLDRGKMDTTNE